MIVGIVFDNEEPPPLDEFEHSILPKSIQTGYFSGGQGLFDDNDEDESFWGQPNKSIDYSEKQVAEEPKKITSKVLILWIWLQLYGIYELIYQSLYFCQLLIKKNKNIMVVHSEILTCNYVIDFFS